MSTNLCDYHTVNVLDNGFYRIVSNTSSGRLSYDGKGLRPAAEPPSIVISKLVHSMAAIVSANHEVYDTELVFIIPDYKIFCAKNKLHSATGTNPASNGFRNSTNWYRYFPDKKNETFDNLKKVIDDCGLNSAIIEGDSQVGWFTDNARLLRVQMYHTNSWDWTADCINDYRSRCTDLANILYAAKPSTWQEEQLFCSVYWR